MPDQPLWRSWFRRPRLSVRASMVLVLLLGGGIGWVVRSARIQRGAVAAIQRAGGRVWYSWEFKDGKPISNSRPWWPRWLVDRVGVDYFGRVVMVVENGGGSDEVLIQVGRLDRVEELNLGFSSPVTDDGLAHLENLAHVRWAALCFKESPELTDAGLAYLGRVRGIQELDVMGTSVSDAGMAHVGDLQDLRVLSLWRTRIGDAGLARLEGLKNLETIDLRETRVTDGGVRRLQEALPKLKITR
jgi:internalin A